MKKDFKREFSACYLQKKGQISIVEVPEFQYLMIDGQGDPNDSQTFQEAVESLFGMSYKIKFANKANPNTPDYTVMPLEGLWWAEDMSDFAALDRSEWLWTMMILQPDFIDAALVEQVKMDLAKAKKLPALAKVRFEAMSDGLSAQTLHLGPFAEEQPTIQQLHQFIHDNGFQLSGKHREIYLSDMRRSAPEKLKTIIRQPMARKGGGNKA